MDTLSYRMYCSPAPSELEPGVEVDPEVGGGPTIHVRVHV